MRKLERRTHIASGVDAFVGRLMEVVHLDAPFVVFDTGGFETHVFNVGSASRRGENLVEHFDGFLAVTFDRARQTFGSFFDFQQVGFEPQVQTFFFEYFADDCPGFRIVLVDKSIGADHHCDLGTQPLHGLSQLAADGAAAKNHELLWEFCLFEERFAGQAIFDQARNGWHERASAGANHGPAEADFFAVEIQCVGSGELRGSVQNIDAHTLHAFGSVVMSHVRSHLSHPLHHCREVDFDAADLHTELLCVSCQVRDVGGLDERLGRNTTGDEAVTAHQMFLDDRRPSAQHGGTAR